MSHVIDLKRIVPVQNAWMVNEIRAHDEGPGAYEYIDRDNHNTVCIGTFEEVPKVPDLPDRSLIGRRIISVLAVDAATGLPIIRTVKSINGYHLHTGYGGFFASLCLLEIE
jgi:hypothetical protein